MQRAGDVAVEYLVQGTLGAAAWALESSERVEWALGEVLAQRWARRIEGKIHNYTQQHHKCCQCSEYYPLGAHGG